MRRAAILVLLAAAPALAHDDNAFYRSLRNGACCSDRDCAPAEARITRSGWEVKWKGQWTPVPERAMERVANPTGEPVLCATEHRILCFVPGSGA